MFKKKKKEWRKENLGIFTVESEGLLGLYEADGLN